MLDTMSDGIGFSYDMDHIATKGAISLTGVNWSAEASSRKAYGALNFSANSCNSFYGGSNTVQPKMLAVQYLIKY